MDPEIDEILAEFDALDFLDSPDIPVFCLACGGEVPELVVGVVKLEEGFICPGCVGDDPS